MCDKQVFTLLTAVPYGTEVLSPCLALTSSIPGRPPPALRLLPATPVATCLVDFLARAHRHILGVFFYSSPATPTLLCASGADFYHYADETERPGFLGNTQACWYIWKMPYCLDAIRKSWLDLVFPGMPGLSDIAKPKGYTGYITAGCVNLPKSLFRWLIQDHCQLCQDLMSQ